MNALKWFFFGEKSVFSVVDVFATLTICLFGSLWLLLGRRGPHNNVPKCHEWRMAWWQRANLWKISRLVVFVVVIFFNMNSLIGDKNTSTKNYRRQVNLISRQIKVHCTQRTHIFWRNLLEINEINICVLLAELIRAGTEKKYCVYRFRWNRM